MNQQTLSDMEYGCRKRKTKREEFLEIMDEIIPWDEWVDVIKPYYPSGKRGRPPKGIEKMLRMYLLQKGVTLGITGCDGLILQPGDMPLLSRWRQAIRTRLDDLLGEQSPLAAALLLVLLVFLVG